MKKALTLLIVSLFLPFSAYAAITRDSATDLQFAHDLTFLSYSVTVNSTANNLVVVGNHTSCCGEFVVSITFDGTPMTLADEVIDGHGGHDAIYYVTNASVGTHTVAITTSLHDNIWSQAIVYDGVNQTTPFGQMLANEEEYPNPPPATSSITFFGVNSGSWFTWWNVSNESHFDATYNDIVVNQGGTGKQMVDSNTAATSTWNMKLGMVDNRDTNWFHSQVALEVCADTTTCTTPVTPAASPSATSTIMIIKRAVFTFLRGIFFIR